MELKAIASDLGRWWALLLTMVLAGGAAGWAVSYGGESTYEARTRVLVGPLDADADTVRANSQLTRTYAELVTSGPILDAVALQLRLPYTASELREAVEPTADSATRILVIRVQDAMPDRAARIADAIAAELVSVASNPEGLSQGQISIVDPALAGEPLETRPWMLVIIAGFVGLATAATAVLLWEHFKDAVHDEDDVRDLGLTVFGILRLQAPRPRRGDPLAVHARPQSSISTQFRMLATKTALASGGPRTILILPDGRSTASGELAANLAAVLAEREDIVLIDGDWRSRAITDIFAIGPEDTSDGETLQVEHDWGTTIRVDGIDVVPAPARRRLTGTQAAAAVTLLQQFEAEQEQGQEQGIVLIHSCPLDVTPEGLLWANAADVTLIIARRHSTRRRELLELAHSLELAGAVVAGVVLEDGRSNWLGRRSPVRRRKADVERPPAEVHERDEPLLSIRSPAIEET